MSNRTQLCHAISLLFRFEWKANRQLHEEWRFRYRGEVTKHPIPGGAASGAVKPRPAVGVTNIPNHDARPEPAPGYTDVCTHLYCSDRSKYSPVDDTG